MEQLLAAMGEWRGLGAADRPFEACVGLLGIDAAAVSLVFAGGNVGSAGASRAAARRYDKAQFTFGEGPCLDAVARQAPLGVGDLADPVENRWPSLWSGDAGRPNPWWYAVRSWWPVSTSAPWTCTRSSPRCWRTIRSQV